MGLSSVSDSGRKRNLVLYVTVVDDLELLRKRVEELERSNADLDQFAAAVSHDLQEPIRMVAQFCELLSAEMKSQGAVTADTEVFLRYIAGGADRAKRLIDGLLSYSRVGQCTLLTPVSMDSVLADAVVLLNGAVAEAGAVVTKDTLPTVRGDFQQLVRVMANLLTNAIKFSDGLARIHVSAQAVGSEWVISVADNGIGIDSRHLERVFGIFQRLHSDRRGTGIGLATCKKIIERHGGRIWAESVPGRGSIFRFSLAPGDS